MKDMKKFLLIIFMLLSSLAFSQFCGTATSYGIIAPSPVAQQTPIVNTGRPYWIFFAKAGCSFTFETCGLTTMDTELEILAGTGGTPIVYNDDACSSTQSRIIWVCPTTGTYTIYITRYGFWGTCYALNANVRMRYSSTCTSPLPVELTDFTATCNDNMVDLKWTTASEQNSDKFIIEKTRDLENWVRVDSLDAAGSSSTEIKYQYNDVNVYGF